MSFQSGRVSFCRFAVSGDAPASISQELLDQLSANAYTDSSIGAPGEIESGWITGDHLYDTQFTFDKNAFGNLLLFAMRVDRNRIPAEVRYAYQRAHEQAVAAGNPSGFLSRAQKKEVRDLVDRQVHDELATGKHRRSKQVDLVWDLANGQLYCAASGNKIHEALSAGFRGTFDLDLEMLTAGALAGAVLQGKGQLRDYEDLHPSPFTPPPSDRHRDQDEAAQSPQDASIPNVPWAHTSTDAKDFLGNEWLIWLWWLSEMGDATVEAQVAGQKRSLSFTLVQALDMECAWGYRGKQGLREAAPTRMSEAAEGLKNGKWPRKTGLILADGESQWELSLQADRLLVSAALLPEITDTASPRDLVEQRLLRSRELAQSLDGLYETFLRQRTSSAWDGTRQNIRDWIGKRRRK
ncbi:MAG: hypothetical protein WD042_09445 [Phycisphaeraceae bacterium]